MLQNLNFVFRIYVSIHSVVHSKVFDRLTQQLRLISFIFLKQRTQIVHM